jgi:hypothetical protein
LKARIELANPQGQLVPGMFANLIFHLTRVKRSAADSIGSSDPDR